MVSLQQEQPDFVKQAKKLFIDGKWQAAASGQEIETINPATGQVLARIAAGDGEDVDRAVKAARRAFESDWSRWTPHRRQLLLMRVHDIILENFEEVALLETLDMGQPLAKTTGAKEAVSKLILFFASQTASGRTETNQNSLPGEITTLTFKAPIGVVGGIIPWNAPLQAQWWIIGAALATGCTAILKPAEVASLSILRTAELLQEAGVPDGVINVVTGYGATAGASLAGHPDVDRVVFTGSTGTGKKIVEASVRNMKRVQLELGGKSPDIIFADADLDKAVPTAAMAVFNNSGQICLAGTRIFVQRSIQDEFLERLKEFTRGLRVGDGRGEVDLGPVVSQQQLDRVLGYVEAGAREGATLVTGGQRMMGDLASGYFIEPTIFADVRNDMVIAQEEIFGPVVSLIPFDDEADALRLANDTIYGLGGGVWTQNIQTAMKMAKGIRSGAVYVNCWGLIDPAVGFGGTKMSGYGWKGGREHIEGFLYQKSVYINLG